MSGLGRFLGKLGRGAGRAIDVAADLARAIRAFLPGKAKRVADVVIVADEGLDAVEKAVEGKPQKK